MMSTIHDSIKATIQAYVRENHAPDDLTYSLIASARYDIWYGPGGDYPEGFGFCSAMDRIRDWMDELPDTVYLQDGYVSETEPVGEFYDPESDQYWDADDPDAPEGAEYIEPTEYYVIDRNELADSILGRELRTHL